MEILIQLQDNNDEYYADSITKMYEDAAKMPQNNNLTVDTNNVNSEPQIQDNTNMNKQSETQTQGDTEGNKNESEYQRDTLQVVPEGAIIIPNENGGQSVIITQQDNKLAEPHKQNSKVISTRNELTTTQTSEQIHGTNAQEQFLNNNNIKSKDDFYINASRPMLDKVDITLPFKDNTDATRERMKMKMKNYFNDNSKTKEQAKQLQDFADAAANITNVI